MEQVAVFSTPEVGRIFIACRMCGRIMPHYVAYPPVGTRGKIGCKCGHREYSPVTLPEWKAAWWVLVVGWLWRKTIRRMHDQKHWDPRLPIRQTRLGA